MGLSFSIAVIKGVFVRCVCGLFRTVAPWIQKPVTRCRDLRLRWSGQRDRYARPQRRFQRVV